MKLFFLYFFISFQVFSFDHSHKLLDHLLKKTVKTQKAQTLVDYSKIKSNPKKLKQYLSQITSVSQKKYNSFNRNQKLSFLINAYNAYTILFIVDNYPIKSIKKLGSVFSSPWSKKIFDLFQRKVSLDEIEHTLIRKNFKEPRIHFAVNCASIGCPNILNEAWTAKKLNKQFQRATKGFLLDTNKNFYEENSKTLFLSKIFQWYGKDFEESHGSVQKFVQSYHFKNKIIENTDFTKYDWNLNQWTK